MSNKIKSSQNIKLKNEVKEMLKMLGVSASYFRSNLPTLAYRKYKNSKKTLSLAEQHTFLKEMLLADKGMRKQMEEQKEFIKKDQATKSAMQEEIPKEQLEGVVKSLFERV